MKVIGHHHVPRIAHRDDEDAPFVGKSERHHVELFRGLRGDARDRFAVRFTGEIGTNDMLIIGEGAKVTADITCGSVVINGEVTGNIKATEMVELHKPAKVKGDITTPSLMVDKGVQFDGSSKMDSTGSNLVTLNRREGSADRP